MTNIANDLFFLNTSLSQLKNKDRVISLFIGAINHIFPKQNFNWTTENSGNSENSILISTRNNVFGHITFNAPFKNSENDFILFQNSCQMLAIVLENLENERLINNQKMHLQIMVDEQTKSIQTKQDELNEINEEYATLNEELLTSNLSLLKVNQNLEEEITEHKITVQELQKSEAYFKGIFNNAAVGKSITSIDGTMQINDAFCKILGYTKEELQSTKWKNITYPDDIEENDRILRTIISGQRNTASWQKRYIHKTGKIIWVEISTTLMRDSQNSPEYFITTIVDITEIINANLRISEGEEKLARIIDGTRAGTWEWNIQTGETEFNETWANIIGYTLKELEPISIETWIKFAHPDDLVLSNELLQKHFNKEIEYYEIESRLKHRNGTWIWVLDRGKVTTWTKDGKPLLMHGTHQDITERKNAEIALRDSEYLLAQSQRISSIGSYSLNIKTGLWKSSEILDEIFGIEKTDDHSFEGWLSVVHPDDQHGMNQYFMNEVIDQKKRFNKEYRIVSIKDKKTKWVHGIGELEFDNSGNPIRMTGTIQDISERKKFTSELFETNELLSQFVMHSPIYAYIKEVTPKESKVIKASENYIDMIGISGSQMVGKTMQDLFPKELADNMTADDWHVVSKGESIKIEEELNGKYFTSIKFPIGIDGKHLLAGYTIDITERKKSELLIKQKNLELNKTNKKLKKAKEKAEESDRLKTSFLANMSHEIRTPLNSIMGFSSLLPEEESHENISSYSQIIVQNSEQLVSIIDGIVLYSKLQTGLLTSRPSKFKIIDLLSDIKQSFNLPVYQKNTNLRIGSELDSNAIANCDYDKVRQVLSNLISNAFKYTPEGEILLEFYVKSKSIEFKVKDTGIGIPSKEKKHIFERFYRGANVEKSTIRGTGLGLSIVKELVELLGGTIKVKNNVGRGTSFIFTVKSHS